MRNIVYILLIGSISLGACKNSAKPVTRASDYEKYFHLESANEMPSIKHINTDIAFWGNRLEKNPGDDVAKVSLAGLYSARFKTAGDIKDIYTSDSLYLIANGLFKTSTSSIYRSLAANCITRHKFQQAKLYLDSALTLGDDKYVTHLMRFDVFIELGATDAAEQSLKHISPKNNFDYLIREAKILDHKGNIGEAIKRMELAREKALESKRDVLILWATSNLGDMYGHANRFKEAYQYYLDVLEKKPDYLYALKGIAWLAFSHDKNVIEAKRILQYLSKLHPIPDYDLLSAEIASYEKDADKKQDLINKFMKEVRDPRYGDMYNKYVFNLMIDENKDFGKALQIAEREVNNRPTSQSYDLLAWAYYNLGKKEKALKIVRAHVEDKNHEPDALYHVGIIYAGMGNTKKAKLLLQEAQKSAFELGPELTAKIEQQLVALAN